MRWLARAHEALNPLPPMPRPQETELFSNERNAVLRDLEPVDYEWLARHLEEVTLRAGEVLTPANVRPSHIYFPETGVVSHVAEFSDGSSVEVGTVGYEGFAGIAAFLGAESSPHKTMVQIDATLRRIPLQLFEAALEELPAFERVLRRSVDAYLFQVGQNAACNRMHDLGRRAARWLLMTHDRVGTDTFSLTHEFLAMMLGVRRAGVSEAAAEMQRRGAIRYSRGRVTVLDRGILEQLSCECYGVVRERFDRMLRGTERRAELVPALELTQRAAAD